MILFKYKMVKIMNYEIKSLVNCPNGVNWRNGWGTYKAGTWPNECWRPLADNSPWNTPVPINPTIIPESDIYVNTIISTNVYKNYIQATPVPTLIDWTPPIFYSQSTDPWFRLHCSQPWGTCEFEEMVIQIPQQAHASGGTTGTITYNSKGQPMCEDTDGGMVIIDQANNLEYDIWQLCPRELPIGGTQANPTDIYCSWGGIANISKLGDGISNDGTPMIGTNGRAARTPLTAGTIRIAELEAGEINHSLSLVIDNSNGKRVYPAGTGTGRYGGNQWPPMGQRFYLAMSPSDIDNMSINNTLKIIYKALAKYGGYMVDTGGGGFALQIESDWSFVSFGYPGKINTNPTTQPYLTSWGTITLDNFPKPYLKAISPPIIPTISCDNPTCTFQII